MYVKNIYFKTTNLKTKNMFQENGGYAFQKIEMLQISRFPDMMFLKMIPYLFLYSFCHFGNS